MCVCVCVNKVSTEIPIMILDFEVAKGRSIYPVKKGHIIHDASCLRVQCSNFMGKMPKQCISVCLMISCFTNNLLKLTETILLSLLFNISLENIIKQI